MKSKIEYLIENLQKIPDFEKFEIFQLKGKEWTNEITKKIVDDEKTNKLLSPINPSRKSRSSTEAIKLESGSISIIVRKSKGTRPHIGNLQLLAENALENASLKFSAHHDPLTGLFNRTGAMHAFDFLFPKAATSTPAEDSNYQASLSPSISIFSLDIDHFKQINDTFGHKVGDTVLQNFSSTLTNTIKELNKTQLGDYILSRPGGEEFEIIYLGAPNKNLLKSIANTLLKDIREQNNGIKDSEDIFKSSKSISYPDKVLASIGVATSSSSQKSDVLEKLRTQADQALYRAKKDGRNTYRLFDEIHKNHGRVIEYHDTSDIAIIDIGKTTLTKNGDLYKVYYPPFTGEQDCILDDGRSKKVIGSYIAIECAEIQVIDTQAEISTCLIVGKSHPIPTGALLKKIPTGTRPVTYTSRKFPLPFGNFNNLTSSIASSIENNDFLGLINISPRTLVSDISETTKNLEKLATLVVLNFPSGVKIFSGFGATLNIQLNHSDFGKGLSHSGDKNASQLIEESLKPIQDQLPFFAGVFTTYLEDRIENPTAEVAIHLARAALHCHHRLSDKKNDLFVYFSSKETLLMWRRSRSMDDAISDYRNFKSYGLSSSDIDNQIGLSIIESEEKENYDIAENAFRNAINNSPQNGQYQINLALTHTKMSKYSDALAIFKINEEHTKNRPTSAYLIAYAKCIIESWSKIKMPDQNDYLSIVDACLSKPMKEIIPNEQLQWLKEISEWRINLHGQPNQTTTDSGTRPTPSGKL